MTTRNRTRVCSILQAPSCTTIKQRSYHQPELVKYGLAKAQTGTNSPRKDSFGHTRITRVCRNRLLHNALTMQYHFDNLGATTIYTRMANVETDSWLGIPWGYYQKKTVNTWHGPLEADHIAHRLHHIKAQIAAICEKLLYVCGTRNEKIRTKGTSIRRISWTGWSDGMAMGPCKGWMNAWEEASMWKGSFGRNYFQMGRSCSLRSATQIGDAVPNSLKYFDYPAFLSLAVRSLTHKEIKTETLCLRFSSLHLACQTGYYCGLPSRWARSRSTSVDLAKLAVATNNSIIMGYIIWEMIDDEHLVQGYIFQISYARHIL